MNDMTINEFRQKFEKYNSKTELIFAEMTLGNLGSVHFAFAAIDKKLHGITYIDNFLSEPEVRKNLQFFGEFYRTLKKYSESNSNTWLGAIKTDDGTKTFYQYRNFEIINQLNPRCCYLTLPEITGGIGNCYDDWYINIDTDKRSRIECRLEIEYEHSKVQFNMPLFESENLNILYMLPKDTIDRYLFLVKWVKRLIEERLSEFKISRAEDYKDLLKYLTKYFDDDLKLLVEI